MTYPYGISPYFGMYYQTWSYINTVPDEPEKPTPELVGMRFSGKSYCKPDPECAHVVKNEIQQKQESVERKRVKHRRTKRPKKLLKQPLVKSHRRFMIQQPKSSQRGFGRHGHRTA